MGDMGDFYNDVRQWGKKKRAKTRESSPAILQQHNITFETKNGGAHLIVSHKGQTADFWPGTGKFLIRGGGSGRGVFNLIRELEKA